MDLKGKVALFPFYKTTVDLIDNATGEVVQQFDVQGTIHGGAFLQKNIAAISMCKPRHGVHVLDVQSGKLLSKFILPNGQDAKVALSRDAITLAVGTDTGV